MKTQVTVHIKRYDPETERSWEQTYVVPAAESLPVMALLDYIYEHVDQTLSYRRYRCYIGVCTSCQLKVNGKSTRGCSAVLQPGDEVTVEPASGRRVLRDLVTVL